MRVLVAVLCIWPMLTACSGPQQSLSSPSPTLPTTPTFTVSPSPSPSPPPDSSRPSSGATVSESAAGAELRCEAWTLYPDRGYAVMYLADWYVGSVMDGWDACSLFGRSPFATEDDPAIVIFLTPILREPWDDPFATTQPSASPKEWATTIGGRPAILEEFGAFTEDAGINMSAGELTTRYSVELSEDWYLSANAISYPDTHDDDRRVLQAMLESLMVLGAS